MRARELLQEDYTKSLQSDLNNLLVGAKGTGAKSINTSDLVRQLDSMGYSVDINSVMGLLQDNPAITGATPDNITFPGDDGQTDPGTAGNTQDSASRVSDMASKATKIG